MSQDAAPPASSGRSTLSRPGPHTLTEPSPAAGSTRASPGPRRLGAGHGAGTTHSLDCAPNPPADRGSGGRAGEPDSAPGASAGRRLLRARPGHTHKVSNSSLAAPSKVSLCRFWNVSQRSRCSPRSAEDAGVAGGGGGGGSGASSGGGSPRLASWARGDDCLGRRFADDCLAAARLPPPAWPAGRRARLAAAAEAMAAGAAEAPGRFCPRGLAAALLLARRMAPAAGRAGLAARASPPPCAPPPGPARAPARQPACLPRGRCARPPGPGLSHLRRHPARSPASGPAPARLHPAGLTGQRRRPPLPTARTLAPAQAPPSLRNPRVPPTFLTWGVLGQPRVHSRVRADSLSQPPLQDEDSTYLAGAMVPLK